MNILDKINILCPNCKKLKKVDTESFNKFDIQKCDSCDHDFTLFDVIDAYVNWENYISKGFDIYSNLTIKDMRIDCNEPCKDVIDDINKKTNLLKLTKELVNNTIKYGTSYLRTIVKDGKFSGFEVLDPKKTRIKSEWGTQLPNQVTLGLVPTEYYEIDGKWSYSSEYVNHFTTPTISISRDNLYGLPIIYPLLRTITYYQQTRHDHFKNEITIGFDVPNFLLEKQELHNISWALHEVDLFKYSIEMIIENITNYLTSVFRKFYGEDTKIGIRTEYYTSDEILKNTGYELEIMKYRTDIKKTKIDTYKSILKSGIITEDEFEKMISSN